VKVGGAMNSSGPINEKRFLNALLGPKGEKVEYMIQNKEVREDLIRKGIKRVKDFNWMISSEQTAEVYMKVLKKVVDVSKVN
jgi:hypothetical protein